ncbi:Alpha carbonic anhydrase domain [Dillenia turbinata]|uniref:Alpha carbonic anhydrase domain n=1 Tax=Dillenia turbinata TaxID=194707 RepID=A0AAN8VYN8_9MAGN
MSNFSFSVLLICLLCLLLTGIAQEVEDEREFDYIKGSEKGPERWGELKKEWKVCENGKMQSPIDMSNRRVKIIAKMGDIKRKHKPCNATIKNRGHDIMLRWEGNGDAGSIEINGTQYYLQQFHWHAPTEHSINGRRYALELHMVHVDPKTNRTAVIGQLYKFGHPDHFLAKLGKSIRSIVDKEEEINIGRLDPREIKLGGSKIYRYMGSLTVPPCTEGVIWTINKKMGSVSHTQVKLLRDAVHDVSPQEHKIYARGKRKAIATRKMTDMSVSVIQDIKLKT